MTAYKRYDDYLPRAQAQAKKNKDAFNYNAIKERTKELLEKYVPKFAMPIQLKLPEIRKPI